MAAAAVLLKSRIPGDSEQISCGRFPPRDSVEMSSRAVSPTDEPASEIVSSDQGRVMSKAKPFLIGAFAGAALVYVSLQFHLVRADDGVYLVPRAPQASLGLAYADIREMSAEQLQSVPELARAMAAQENRDLLAAKTKKETRQPPAHKAGADDAEWDSVFENQPSASDDDSLNAPIWNPFAEDVDENTAAVDPLAAAMDDPSPFADITNRLDSAKSRLTESVRESLTPSPQGSQKPFDLDFAADRSPHAPTRTTKHSRGSVPYPRNQLGREDLRSSLNRRAREIYEESRRRSLDPIDTIFDRSESRADNVIDELVSPHENRTDELIDRAAESGAPKRYQRRNR